MNYAERIIDIKAAAEKMLAGLKECVTPIDGLIAFAGSPAGEQVFGKEGAAKRIYATTDAKKGALKGMADKNGYTTFTIPDDIGGRFSVLSAVGLLPIAVAGIDIRAIMNGARALCSRETFRSDGLDYAITRQAFADAMNTAIWEGSGRQVKLTAPFIASNKAGIVKKGLELGVPYELTWSCYEGGDRPCGKCGTCIDRRKAFEANGVEDPAMALYRD